MFTLNATLYNVDPHLRKVSRAIESFARTIIDIYLGIFAAIGSGFLILFGALFVLIGIMLPMKDYSAWSSSAVLLPLGLAWILSPTMRKMTWIFIGFSVVWVIFLTATLLPFLEIEAKQPFIVQVILGMAYLIPPIIATGIAINYQPKKG